MPSGESVPPDGTGAVGTGHLNWVVDLDGVMWRGRVPIPGSVEAVAALLERGDRVLFCTNNSAESGPSRAARLSEQGVPEGCEVVTSADAVAQLVASGERVLVLGGTGLHEALRAVGATTVSTDDDVASGDSQGWSGPGGFDAVVVGLSRDFDYAQLDRAQAAVRAGARLLASNTDSSFPGADGLHPGCGALVAAVETASGASALAAGKPLAPMAALIRDRLGVGAGAANSVVVGDRADTDGRLAENLGWPFALVLSGVTTEADLPVEVEPTWVAADLAGVVAALRTQGAPR